MGRRTSLDNINISLSRELESQYDNVRIVADNIVDVGTVAGLDLVSLAASIQEIVDFTGITISTVPNGTAASWNATTKVLTIPEGDQGSQGTQGVVGPQGPQGVAGNDGINGVSVDHIKFTNSTDPENDQYQPGENDTYTMYGDIGETLVLGYFTVHNGATGGQGIQGVTGNTGVQGIQGIQGLTGATGPQGNVGQTGNVGSSGVNGQTPLYEFTYNAITGDLEYSLIGYQSSAETITGTEV